MMMKIWRKEPEEVNGEALNCGRDEEQRKAKKSRNKLSEILPRGIKN